MVQEYTIGGVIYGITDRQIERNGHIIDVEFLGCIDPTSFYRRLRDGGFAFVKEVGERAGELSLCNERVDLGELEQEIKKGQMIVGKPLQGEKKYWLSSPIDNIR